MVIAVIFNGIEVGDIKGPEWEDGQIGLADGQDIRLRTKWCGEGTVGLSFALPCCDCQAVFQVDDGYDMHVENYTGWDIGGAHLKIACLDNNGVLCALEQFATPLWQGIERLADPVPRALNSLPAGNCVHALTMTGELADCFPGRQDGVTQLANYISAQLGRSNPIYVYAGNKGLITLDRLHGCHEDVASANWHATATYVAKYLGSGILIDLGSTTTDLIPFRKQQVYSQGYTDQERLRSGELVYTGMTRTPVMAVLARLPYKNVWQPIAAEYFASMADVYRITGELDECFDLMPAADGGEKTRYHSIKRLARMLGTEYDETHALEPWFDVARYIAEKQFEKIDQAFYRVTDRLGNSIQKIIVAAGAGRFIIEKLALKNDYKVVDFEDLLPLSDKKLRTVNNCSTAVAVAALTRIMRNAVA